MDDLPTITVTSIAAIGSVTGIVARAIELLDVNDAQITSPVSTLWNNALQHAQNAYQTLLSKFEEQSHGFYNWVLPINQAKTMSNTQWPQEMDIGDQSYQPSTEYEHNLIAEIGSISPSTSSSSTRTQCTGRQGSPKNTHQITVAPFALSNWYGNSGVRSLAGNQLPNISDESRKNRPRSFVQAAVQISKDVPNQTRSLSFPLIIKNNSAKTNKTHGLKTRSAKQKQSASNGLDTSASVAKHNKTIPNSRYGNDGDICRNPVNPEITCLVMTASTVTAKNAELPQRILRNFPSKTVDDQSRMKLNREMESGDHHFEPFLPVRQYLRSKMLKDLQKDTSPLDDGKRTKRRKII